MKLEFLENIQEMIMTLSWICLMNSTSSRYDDLCYIPLEGPFTFQLQVSQCLFSVKSHAIGLDDLEPIFIKSLTYRLLPYLTHQFNTILTQSTIPDQ